METNQLSIFPNPDLKITQSLTKTFFEKRYRVGRTTLVKMLKEVPGYKMTKSWYIHPAQANLIIQYYG